MAPIAVNVRSERQGRAGLRAAAVLIAVALAGCSGAAVDAPPPPTLEPGQPTPTFAPTATDRPAGNVSVGDPPDGSSGCLATQGAGSGPNYVPGAPERSAVGEGYRLEGNVLRAGSCLPIAGATVEVWLAGPDGAYGDDWRASLTTNDSGAFTIDSHRPPSYGDLAPHIHVRVSAGEFLPVFLQHYPEPNAITGTLAVVLAEE